MKVNVDKKKLNRLFKLTLFVFIIVLIFAFYVLPKSKEEIVLIIDSKNRVMANLLSMLGYDTNLENIKFEELLGKEIKVIELPKNSLMQSTHMRFIEMQNQHFHF